MPGPCTYLLLSVLSVHVRRILLTYCSCLSISSRIAPVCLSVHVRRTSAGPKRLILTLKPQTPDPDA